MAHTFNQKLKDYFDRRFGQETPFLHFIRTQSQQEKLPPIQVPVYLGRLLYLLAKIQNAKRILEIGTLGGYSSAWLSQALPANGSLITCEVNPLHAKQAQKHLKDKNVEVRIGHAVDLMAQMVSEKEDSFDLIFIDADKENNSLYLEWSLALSRPGTLILIDNLIPKGEEVGYAANEEAQYVYQFNDYLAGHPELEAAVIPTLVGMDARLDGLAIVRVKDPN